MDYKTALELMKTFDKIDPEMDDRLISMAQRTWAIIGYDVLESRKIYGDFGDCKRREVIDTVCDADYMLLHGDDVKGYAYFLYLTKHNAKHRDKIMKKAFPYKTYGY